MIKEPPIGLVPSLRFLGPGLIISAALVGSGELVATTKLGAEAGFTLLWLVVAGCVLKVFVQIEMARYAISAGETTLTALNRLPGPRLGVNWVLWLWLAATALTYGVIGGIVGGVTQAVTLLVPVNPDVVAFVVVGGTLLLLVLGRYRGIETACVAMVVVFTAMTLVTVSALQWTPFAFSGGEVMSGLTFELPATAGAVATALGAFGLIGVTATDIVGYPYWCLEKGYARWTGPREDSADWLRRAQGWIRVMRLDAFVALAIYGGATVAFYLIGAAVLNRQGLNPDNQALVATLVEAYSPVLGRYSPWVVAGGAAVILYSTFLVAIGATARTLTDFLHNLGLIDQTQQPVRERSIAIFSIVLPLLVLSIYLTGANPVRLIIWGGVALAFLLPVITIGVLYLRFRHTDPRLRPGRAWDLALFLSCGSFVLIGAFGLWRFFV